MNKNDKFDLKILADYQCELGEGPFYDHRTHSLYHVDITKNTLYRIIFKEKIEKNSKKFFNDSSNIVSLDKRILSELCSIVIPLENDPNLLLVSLRNKLAIYNFEKNSYKKIFDVSSQLKENEHFNDGKCDAKGRLFVGTICRNKDNTVKTNEASLFKLENENFIKIATNFSISNGLCWSKDNKTMFFNDSEDKKIYKFDYNLDTGVISNQKVFINILDPKLKYDLKETDYPDGCTIDQDNNLWVALWDGGRIVKISTETGKTLETVYTQCPRTTSVCFGKLGTEDVIFITSATHGLSQLTDYDGRTLVLSSQNDLNAIPENRFFKYQV